MSVYDQRLAALEKDAATMKQDIIYKLDDTNHTVTMIKGIAGNQGQDIKEIKNQLKMVNVHLDGVDTRLEGIKEEIRAIKDQQDGQGRDLVDIRRHLDALAATMATKEDLSALENRMQENIVTLEKRVLDAFQQLVTIIDTRLPPQEK